MRNKNKKKKCLCPVCDTEMQLLCSELLYCEPCQKKFITCSCGQVVAADWKVCPSCGKNLK